jgi:ABC-type glutathione transport system ATPase component
MKERITALRNKLEREKGQRDQLASLLGNTKLKLKRTRRKLRQSEEAREIIREVGIKTQQELQYHISDIASLALDTVFNDPYELVVDFVQRRNKTECDLLFERDGTQVVPKEASGVGAVDIAAFALRIAAWSMRTPRSRNVILLDEPLKHLDTLRQPRASEMIKKLSDQLGLQFIIITHEDALTEHADKTFTVRLKNGVSQVT